MRLLLGFCLVIAFLMPEASADCQVSTPTCYVDTISRVLEPDNVNPGSTLSLEYCAQLCHTYNKTLAGVEFGSQCYCGTHLEPNTTKADPQDCNMSCSGESSQKCGGVWRISVFSFNCSGTPVAPPGEEPYMVNPCIGNTKWSSMPFCDVSLPIDERAANAVSMMTLEEKIANLATSGAPIASLGLPTYNWWSEATHGIQSARNDASALWQTNFAFPITTAMSFNRSMWWATGQQIAREARAFMNAGNAYSTFWAPVINLARDPRWGRNIETPGEDPYLTGQYAIQFVKGFQESVDDETHVQASACCKHYVANSMEDSTVDGVHWDRYHFDATVTAQDLVDSYMAPFQDCVERGEVTSLMCSYNAVNGVPSCANDWLLIDVAREQWQFDGYITSDCDADSDVFNSHHYTKTPEEAVKVILEAGTDVDCGGFVTAHVQSALDQKLITEDLIDERMKKLFKVRMRLSHFDPIGPLNKISTREICSDYSKELARDGVRQSAVLLKNNHGLLPLVASNISSAAVIGPNSNLSEAVAGYYGPKRPCDLSFNTMVDAVQQYVQNTVTTLGVPNVLSNSTTDIPAAVKMGSSVDQVVLAIGSDLTMAREGHDAVNGTYPYGQTQLINAVANAARSPVIVVILSAIPLDISFMLANPKIGAIIHAGQPSVQTLGIGDLIFGEAVPAGRMVQTIYPGDMVNQISIFDFNMRPGPSLWPRPDCPESDWGKNCKNGTNPGRTHRFYTGKPAVPFGFGLSYTSFEYSFNQIQYDQTQVIGHQADDQTLVSLKSVTNVLEKVSSYSSSGHTGAFPPKASFIPAAISQAWTPLVKYQVKVTNTGSVDADDVVLGFLVPPDAGQNGVPKQVLFGFERVFVPAGQAVTVWLYPNLEDFTRVLSSGQRVSQPGQYTARFGLQETSQLGMGLVEHSFSTR